MRPDDVAEFSAFVRARSGALFRTAVLLTGDRGQAEDLVQSTLERLCRHWRTVSRAQAPEAYARRVLVNLVYDRHRLRRRAGTEVLLGDSGPPSPGSDAYQQILSRDELMRGLRALPVSMRTVLVLRYFEDLADTEIAALLGIRESTVRSQAARGLGKLRARAGDKAAGPTRGGTR
ncbi:SigE family RNA polymerase sigma factor [Actinacidiphila rubida]|uniref:RNA polymerase sigma-70 factor, sigma-E family n=1 Tax=Actinacidiphila rubida TaxID=310780 RepID=A0A1H8UC61_9ACTN|nr:SigE family RNA polymerase sigma factor [Actinacidiphila rubida]SEO63255.1 RNA polymerase sigma-70 factor, sigma-E family [Actinacidiphila rubida]SEP00463.1 RNA polymerase sigma-70 factor, sigma-E family [Actinacidiphila rubida]